MLNEIIEKQVRTLKMINSEIKEKNNFEKQKNTNKDAARIITQLSNLIATLYEAKQRLDFTVDDKMIDELVKINTDLQDAISTYHISEEIVRNSRSSIVSINKDLKEKWLSFYKVRTTDKLKTLRFLKNFNKQDISVLEQQFYQSKDWSYNKDVVIQLEHSIQQADEFIEKLNMSATVTEFFKKMNNGTATLVDLNQEVLDWIDEKNVKYKIKLKFE